MLFQVLRGIINFPLDSSPWFFFLITLFVHVRVSLQFGNGAPWYKCADMLPIHGSTSAQRDASPYTIKVSATTYKVGDKISVTISGRGDFRGYLLVAKQNDGTPVGSFESTDAGSQVISCTHGGQALTHSSKNLKSSVTTQWTAPDTAVGNIILVATVVAVYTEFWVNIKSPVVSPTQPIINKTTTTTTTTTSRPIVTPIVSPVRRKLPFVPVSPVTTPRTTTEKTVEEGDDSVVDCIGNGGVIQIKQSYNTPNYDNRPIQSHAETSYLMTATAPGNVALDKTLPWWDGIPRKRFFCSSSCSRSFLFCLSVRIDTGSQSNNVQQQHP